MFHPFKSHCFHCTKEQRMPVTIGMKHDAYGKKTKIHTELKQPVYIYRCCKCGKLGYSYSSKDEYSGILIGKTNKPSFDYERMMSDIIMLDKKKVILMDMPLVREASGKNWT